MVPEVTPDPIVSLALGETMGIDFMADSQLISFYGVVEWIGVGELSELTYPGSPIIILPDPPYGPGFLPDNMWPIFYDASAVTPPGLGPFAMTTYVSTEVGAATINLYDLGMDFSEFTLIDSFDILVPEPMTAVLLSFGILFVRRR